MREEKNYIAVPLWLAGPCIMALLGFQAWMATSILSLKDDVAGLRAKVELIAGHNIAKQ